MWLSDNAQDFLSKTLLKHAAKRSSAAQLLKHPWLRSLGFKQPVDQIPCSVEVVEPVLPPRPVPLTPPPQHVTVAQPTIAQPAVIDESVVEEDEKVQMPEEIAVTATGTAACQHTICTLSASDLPRADVAGRQSRCHMHSHYCQSPSCLSCELHLHDCVSVYGSTVYDCQQELSCIICTTAAHKTRCP